MKNALNYYYNMLPKDIHQTKDFYKFEYNNKKYVFYLIEDSIDILKYYNLSLKLNSYGIYTHKIMLNFQNEFITYVNNLPYILMEVACDIDKIVTLEEVISFSNITYGFNDNLMDRNNWYRMWVEKQDYFEYQMKTIETKFPILKESSHYFFGLTEMAIALLNNKLDVQKLSVAHKRINKETTLFQFYNPLNFIIDVRVRDVAEYFKHFNNENTIYDIYNYIKNNNLNNEEIILFFIRLIYPTYYYDLYEKIISGKVNEEEMNKVIKNVDNMENIIKKTYMYISNICSIPLIEWLIIKQH